MPNLYAILGLVAIIGLGWWRYEYVVADRDAEKLRADNATADYISAKGKLDTERQNSVDANKRAQDRQTEKEAIQNELAEKIKCIDAGTCGVRVRWREAICAGEPVRGANTSTSGSNDLQAQDKRDFGRWVASIEASVEQDAKVIEGLQMELAVRSDPDACKVKK